MLSIKGVNMLHGDEIIDGSFTEYEVHYIFHVSHEGSNIKRVKCSMKKRADTLRALLYHGYQINHVEEIKNELR